MTPFANEVAFAAVLKARFSNLDNEAAAQVELAKLCTDKSVRETRTTAEFSALFKGPADRSGYGDLKLHDKYLSGIPSCVYRKIELEMFTTWENTDNCFGCGKQGYCHFKCPNCKDKPYTKCADARAMVASGSTQAATSAPVTTSPLASTSAASASPEKSETLAALMAQVKSMREELEHYWAMKEEGF
ncbi:hypothetical protein POSPLADRAFT_1057872 [Postia placenta MAD-698-R-SB12]|uniref:CCHC-type domain-containing protein n=1 Tax=Postia placenta MAD-698-R-SB12 TaxID=670580 RepID=A0A1X6MX37_9APHY|nr:hypothetical protein POSPLADRAFT_1057872 [Postia placenta MAD-698-R-SB12]OSX60928.1 hypothetical protein POSPLADRAFT_1057872 [Postia placenta MAD-698-R-SB12]